MPQCVCCVQASRDGRATRRNRVSSKVNSRGTNSSHWRQRVIKHYRRSIVYNPLTTVAISKLLEVIGISAYFPRRLDRDRSPLGHKPDYRQYVRKSMHACHSVSAACRPAETARRRGEIGSVRRSIRVGRICPIEVKVLMHSLKIETILFEFHNFHYFHS